MARHDILWAERDFNRRVAIGRYWPAIRPDPREEATNCKAVLLALLRAEADAASLHA